MATTKKATATTKKTEKKLTESKPTEVAKELRYVLLNPLFSPIITTKEHYEELKRTNKIVETKKDDVIYFRLNV